jgi:hypothetical protein
MVWFQGDDWMMVGNSAFFETSLVVDWSMLTASL